VRCSWSSAIGNISRQESLPVATKQIFRVFPSLLQTFTSDLVFPCNSTRTSVLSKFAQPFRKCLRTTQHRVRNDDAYSKQPPEHERSLNVTRTAEISQPTSQCVCSAQPRANTHPIPFIWGSFQDVSSSAPLFRQLVEKSCGPECKVYLKACFHVFGVVVYVF